MKPIVSHVKSTYCEQSEVFFYQILTNYHRYEAYVLAEKLINLDLFPYKRLIELPNYTMMDYIRSGIGRLVSHRHLGFERRITVGLNNINTSIIHAHWGPVGVYTLPVAKKMNLPLITSFYGFDTSYSGIAKVMNSPRNLIPFGVESYWASAYKDLFTYGSAFITFGEKMRQMLIDLGAPPQKIYDIHTGIILSLRKFRKRDWKSDGEINILMVNRLVEKKGVTYALDAFAKLSSKYPKLNFSIIGEGPLESQLHAQAHNSGIENKINWQGTKSYSEVLEEMQKAQIFITPSVKVVGDEEGGINSTVIDALALGLPTIATSESGSQLIYHEKSGLMVNQRDSNDLAEKIQFLIMNPKIAEKYSINGRKVIEESFNQIKQTALLEKLYDDMITSWKGY